MKIYKLDQVMMVVQLQNIHIGNKILNISVIMTFYLNCDKTTLKVKKKKKGLN